MTSFYIDGKWVELDELVEKAKKWDKFCISIEKARTQPPPQWWLDFGKSSEYMKKGEK